MVLYFAGFLQPVQGWILGPFSAAQGWLAARYAAIRDSLASPADVAVLRQRLAELEAENARLQQELIELREQQADVEVLSALLGYARTQPENRYLAADVVGQDVSPFLRSVLIGLGSDHGISRGMPVVTERGLVGRVTEVFADVARVTLITDPQIAVNVVLQNSQADAVLAPRLNGEMWVESINQAASVTPGELVLTSGLGGLYPPDIPVGQVLSVRRRDFEVFQQAVIQPSVDFDRLRIVLVITNFRPFPAPGGAP
jgi:rod shape-determining protein MreC